jgi:hypothetical protein
MTRRVLVVVAWGLAGLAIMGGLMAGAFALAGEDIAKPATPIVVQAPRSPDADDERTHSPEPTRSPEPNEAGDDHGGSNGGSDDTGTDDHGGSGGSDDSGSGSSNSGSGSDDSGSGSDDSGSGGDD